MPFLRLHELFVPFGVIIATLAANTCAAQTSETVILLRELLQGRSELSSSYKWRFETRQLKGGRKIRVSEIGEVDFDAECKEYTEDPDHFVRGIAIFDDKSGRFCVRIEATMRWIVGDTIDIVSKREQWCYDGIDYTRLIHEYPGLQLQGADEERTQAGKPAEGHISRSLSDAAGLKIYQRQSGMYSFPEFLPIPSMGFPVRKAALPYSLDLIDEWTVEGWLHDVKTEGNLILLQLIAPEGGRHCAEYSFDIDRGGALTQIALSARPETPPFAVTRLLQKERKPGVWVPSEIETFFLLDGNGYRTTIEAVEIDPDLEGVEFRVEMPAGTTVWDEATDIGYTAIGSPSDQADVIRDFMKENEVRIESKPGSNYRLILVVINFILLAGIFSYVLIRQKRKMRR